MQSPPPLSVVLTLTALIDGLFEAVGARYGIFPIRGPLLRFLWKRFFRVKQLFAALAARFAAGEDLGPRPSRSRAARAPRPRPDEHAFRLTRWVNPKFGWLRRVASESIGASAFAVALRHLLTTDPEMLALLAATPATPRILRPLCHMLGVSVPARPVWCSAASPCAPQTEPAQVTGFPPSLPVAAMPRARSAPIPVGVAPESSAVFFKAA